MGMTLDQYAALHPELQNARDLDAKAPEGKSLRELEEERQQVEDMMRSIREQLDRGGSPEYPLYSAINVIERLTGDGDWAAACRASLDYVYGDLAQESMFTDAAANEIKKLVELREKYTSKWKKQLIAQQKASHKLDMAIVSALRTLDEIDKIAGEDPAVAPVFDEPEQPESPKSESEASSK